MDRYCSGKEKCCLDNQSMTRPMCSTGRGSDRTVIAFRDPWLLELWTWSPVKVTKAYISAMRVSLMKRRRLNKSTGRKYTSICLLLMLGSCTGIPDGIQPVREFDLNRYLGTWYEIARLDHSFERGLDRVTAEYTMRDDGGVRVINKGFSTEKNEWTAAEGKAYFVNEPDEGYLKVSFFGPFYGSYVVFELDKENYQYAFVTGPGSSYLWLLSRTPTVSEELIDRFVMTADALGFDVDKLIFARHVDPMSNV